MPIRRKPRSTAASIAASKANGRKSRGPIPEEILRQVNEKAAKYPIRLLGLAEMRVLNQDLGAAERLYRELIAPYPYLPPLVDRNFQDLARQYLELEAWERIRDAKLEHRWERNKLTQSRAVAEIERDLQADIKQYLSGGLQSLPDSPAKLRMQFGCLEELLAKLSKYARDFSAITDRAGTICALCRNLMDPMPGEEPPSEADLQRLSDLVNEEQQQIAGDYGLARDEKMMTRTECLARLGPTREDTWMERQGDRLRRAIDRKQLLIAKLLKVYGLQPLPTSAGQGERTAPNQQALVETQDGVSGEDPEQNPLGEDAQGSAQ